jgi:hypothetical protein
MSRPERFVYSLGHAGQAEKRMVPPFVTMAHAVIAAGAIVMSRNGAGVGGLGGK